MDQLTWVDAAGRVRKAPTIRKRLKFRIPLHRDLREFVLSRDKMTCQICGAVGSDDGSTPIRIEMDHIISRRNGGAHHPSNLQTLCQSCNARKAASVDRNFKRAS